MQAVERKILKGQGVNALVRYKIGKAIIKTDKAITSFFHLDQAGKVKFYKAVVMLSLFGAAAIKARVYIFAMVWGLADVFAAAFGL